jgi:hypothetical protein
MKIDEQRITASASFPISPATELFLKRNNPVFSANAVENIQKGIAAAMTLITLVLMMLKWFRGSLIVIGWAIFSKSVFLLFSRGCCPCSRR